MKNRFKAKPNVSAARERALSTSVDGRNLLGNNPSLHSETAATAAVVVQSSSQVGGGRQKEAEGNGGGCVGGHAAMPRVQQTLPQFVDPTSEAGQTGSVDKVLGESLHPQGVHFPDEGVTPLEPLEEYSDAAVGNEVTMESEADIVTGSALALSDDRCDKGGGASCSSSVSIGNLIAESYALCQDGVVSGSEALEHDSARRERVVTTLSEEDEVVSQSEGAGECVEREDVTMQSSLATERLVGWQVGTAEGQSQPSASTAPTHDMDARKTKNAPQGKRPVAAKGKERDKQVESESRSSPPPAKRSRRKSSRDKQVKIAPDLGKMTMAELISYNPSANPMQSACAAKDKPRNGARRRGSSESVSRAGEQEGVSSTEPLPPPLMSSTPGTGEREGKGNVDGDGRLVPQLMVDKDGKIVVNENSMVVHSSRVDPEIAADKLETVYEIAGDFRPTTSGSTKRGKIKLWTEDETKVFYRALSQVGTDFTMMTLLVEGRTRGDLKKKFKKEEKANPHKINSALKRRIPIATTCPIQTA